MQLSSDDVAEILNIVDRASGLAHLEVHVGDTHIVVSQHGAPAAAPAVGAPTPPDRHPTDTDPASQPTGAAGPAAAPPAAGQAPAAAPVDGDEGLAVVPAPVVGVFYRAPEPGAAPFVEEGTHVDADTTVGLVEVMKMFNSVTAGTRGTVRRILAGNEEFVEYGQTLLLIEPEA